MASDLPLSVWATAQVPPRGQRAGRYVELSRTHPARMLPAIARLSGLPGDPPPAEPLRLGAPLPANDLREDYVRASLLIQGDEGWIAHPYPAQDSGMISRLARADALIVRPPFAPPAAVGEVVPGIRLAPLGL